MRNFSFSIILLLVTGIAFGHETVPMLQYAMKALAKDVELVGAATKKPTPADVTDGVILMGITRARTASSQIQLILDRAGKFDSASGKLAKGEMTPGIGEELIDKQKELMGFYPVYLTKVKVKLELAEKELTKQFDEKDPEKRDFAPLKTIMTDLEAIVAEAHKLFRPET